MLLKHLRLQDARHVSPEAVLPKPGDGPERLPVATVRALLDALHPRAPRRLRPRWMDPRPHRRTLEKHALSSI